MMGWMKKPVMDIVLYSEEPSLCVATGDAVPSIRWWRHFGRC